MNGIVKKMEKDKYFFAIKQQYIPKIQEDRFSILEDVKTVNIGNDMAVTLSIGINCHMARKHPEGVLRSHQGKGDTAAHINDQKHNQGQKCHGTIFSSTVIHTHFPLRRPPLSEETAVLFRLQHATPVYTNRPIHFILRP